MIRKLWKTAADFRGLLHRYQINKKWKYIWGSFRKSLSALIWDLTLLKLISLPRMKTYFLAWQRNKLHQLPCLNDVPLKKVIFENLFLTPRVSEFIALGTWKTTSSPHINLMSRQQSVNAKFEFRVCQKIGYNLKLLYNSLKRDLTQLSALLNWPTYDLS